MAVASLARRPRADSRRGPLGVARQGGLAVALSDEIVAYGGYVNAPRDHLDADERNLLDEDLGRARAHMERAWLERGAALTADGNAERSLPFEPIETIGHTTSNQPDGW